MNIALGIGRINSAHETDISNNEENEVYVIFKQVPKLYLHTLLRILGI